MAINVFLGFHIFSIVCWSLPFDNSALVAYRKLVRPYFLWSGLFQSWDMFSPRPKSVNSYVDAIVLDESGDLRTWSFPRMEELSAKDRYFKERYRKFVENLQEDNNSSLWPDAARFIARVNSNGSSRMTRVYLARHRSEIAWRGDGQYAPGVWRVNFFFRYIVEPDGLK